MEGRLPAETQTRNTRRESRNAACSQFPLSSYSSSNLNRKSGGIKTLLNVKQDTGDGLATAWTALPRASSSYL